MKQRGRDLRLLNGERSRSCDEVGGEFRRRGGLNDLSGRARHEHGCALSKIVH